MAARQHRLAGDSDPSVERAVEQRSRRPGGTWVDYGVATCTAGARGTAADRVVRCRLAIVHPRADAARVDADARAAAGPGAAGAVTARATVAASTRARRAVHGG